MLFVRVALLSVVPSASERSERHYLLPDVSAVGGRFGLAWSVET